MIRQSIFLVFLVSYSALGSRFIFLGDTGKGNAGQFSVASGMKRHCSEKTCEFVLLLGDNFYPVGVSSTTDRQWESAFRAPYSPLGLTFYPALGNHDYSGNVNAQIAYSAVDSTWKLPARYHRFVRGNTEIFVLDTNDWNKTQADWLYEGLKNSRAPWKIAIGHHPVYSYGQHGNTQSLVKGLAPILRNRADFFLSGHDHDKQLLVDPEDRALRFVVSGAGADTRPVSGGSLSLFHASTLGFSALNLSDEGVATLEIFNQDGRIEFIQDFTRRGVRKSVSRSIGSKK